MFSPCSFLGPAGPPDNVPDVCSIKPSTIPLHPVPNQICFQKYGISFQAVRHLCADSESFGASVSLSNGYPEKFKDSRVAEKVCEQVYDICEELSDS